MEAHIRIQGSNDKVVDFQAELFDLSESVFGRPGPVGGGADGFSGEAVGVSGGPDRSQLPPKFFLDSFDILENALGVFSNKRWKNRSCSSTNFFILVFATYSTLGGETGDWRV